MAKSPVVEFVMMHIRPEATLEEEGTESYNTWMDLSRMASEAPGCIKHYFGRQMEDPSIGIHVWVKSETAGSLIDEVPCNKRGYGGHIPPL